MRKSLILALALTTGLHLLAQDRAKVPLPLQEITLYSSGVGLFERAGDVEGRASLDLRFRVADINDLLKSMVVQDFDGGTISTVVYDSHDPIAKTLRSFAVDLTANHSMRDLLNQIRGEQVSVEWLQKLSGTVLGVEQRVREVQEGRQGKRVQADFLNLFSNGTLQSIPLSEVQRIHIENERLRSELEQALAVLAKGHDTEKKTVSLQFDGEGKRKISISYVVQAPVWKTSYRLVLDEAGKAFLQGWAIVENTTEEDWNNVQLSLVSGRPISFVMDLYQPLYATRPTVQPELHLSLTPQVYGDALESREVEHLARPEAAAVALPEPAVASAGAGIAGRAMQSYKDDAVGQRPAKRLRPDRGVQTMAEGEVTGELFQYAIKNTISIARQKSAMLPIVNQSVETRKLSIYRETVQPKHPLNGLRLKNTTSLHLMQGPITLFDEGAYAGDARLDDLAPGQDRLVSYALDLKTEVASESTSEPESIVSVRLRHGAFFATKKHVQERIYRIKNKDTKEKVVVVEHPINTDWDLESPEKPAERARDVYRFEVNAKAGATEKLVVREKRQFVEEAHVTALHPESYGLYLRAGKVSDRIKEVLRRVIAYRDELSQLSAERARREQRTSEIGQEQARIRENMARLAQNSELYQRYVKKFDEQETHLETLRAEIEKLKDQEDSKQREMNDYLSQLDLE